MKLVCCLLIFLTGTCWLRAEYIPGFDMETCVGKATNIVQGKLNSTGELNVTDVLVGSLPAAHGLKLDLGQYHFERLQKITSGKGPFEVVVFLDKDSNQGWGLVLQYAGLVGLDKEKVFPYRGSYGFLDSEEPEYTRTSFLKALADAVQKAKEVDKLLAAYPNIDRAREMVRFALAHEQVTDGKANLLRHAGHHQLGRIAAALKTQGQDGQKAVLQAIYWAKTPQDQTTLVYLAGIIPLANSALDAVSDFLPRTNPPALRKAAMNTLNAVNAYRAVDYLTPYLLLDDPQLETVLSNLGARSYPPQDGWLNVRAVDALQKLAESMTGKDEIPFTTKNGSGYVIGAVGDQMSHYAHPKLMPLLYRRAVLGQPTESAQGFSDFCTLTGLKYPHEDRASWEAWWSKAQPLLDGNFNLQTVAGRELWMDHYRRADPATQKILMNLWFFEPWIDEDTLIDAAMQNDSAKDALSELWKRGRLSANGRKALAQHFMVYKLVNHPPAEAKNDKTLYGATLEGVWLFPFPTAEKLRLRADISIGPEPPTLKADPMDNSGTGWRNVDFPRRPNDQAPQITRQSSSPPQARAIVECIEWDSGVPEVWKTQWNIGPIQLSNVQP